MASNDDNVIGPYHHTHITSSTPISSTTLLFKPPIENQPYTGTPSFQTWTISSSQLNLTNFSKGLEGSLQPINPILHGSNGNILQFILHTDSNIILTDDIGNIYSIPRNLIDSPTISTLPLTLLYSNQYSLPAVDLKVLTPNLISVLFSDEFIVIDLHNSIYNSPLYSYQFQNKTTSKIPQIGNSTPQDRQTEFNNQRQHQHQLTPISLNFGDHRSLYSAYTYKAHLHLNRHKFNNPSTPSVPIKSLNHAPSTSSFLFNYYANSTNEATLPICYVLCEEGIATMIFSQSSSQPITTVYLFSSYSAATTTIMTSPSKSSTSHSDLTLSTSPTSTSFSPLNSKPIAILDILCEAPHHFAQLNAQLKSPSSSTTNTTPTKTPNKLQPQFSLQPGRQPSSQNTTLAKLQSRSRTAVVSSGSTINSNINNYQFPLTHRQLIIWENGHMAIFYTYTSTLQNKEISTLIPLSDNQLMQTQTNNKIILSDVFTVQFDEHQQFITIFNKASKQHLLLTLSMIPQSIQPTNIIHGNNFRIDINSIYNFKELIHFVKFPIFFQTALQSLKTNAVGSNNIISHNSFTYLIISQDKKALDILNLPYNSTSSTSSTSSLPSSPQSISHTSPSSQQSSQLPPQPINITLTTPDNTRNFSWDPETVLHSLPHNLNDLNGNDAPCDFDTSFVTVNGAHTATPPHKLTDSSFTRNALNSSYNVLPDFSNDNPYQPQPFSTPAHPTSSFSSHPSLMKSSLTNHIMNPSTSTQPASAIKAAPTSTAKHFRFVKKTDINPLTSHSTSTSFSAQNDSFFTPAKAFYTNPTRAAHPKLARPHYSGVGQELENVSDLKQRIIELETEQLYLTQQRDDLKAHVTSLEEINKSHKSEIIDLTEQFQHINNTNNDDKEQKQAFHQAKMALEVQVKTLTNQLAQLQVQENDLSDIMAELALFKQRYQDEVDKNEAMKDQNAQTKLQLDQTSPLGDEVEALRQQILDKSNENGSLVSNLQTLLDKARDELALSQINLQNNQQRLSSLQNEYNELHNTFDDLSREFDGMKIALSSATDQLAEIDAINMTLQSEKSVLQTDHDAALTKIRQLQDELNIYMTKLAANGDNSSDLGDVIAKSIHDAYIKQVGDEIELLRKDLFDKDSIASRWENELTEQSTLLNHLKTELSNKDTTYDDLSSKYATQCEENQGMKDQLTELSEEQESLGNDYDDLMRKHNAILKEKNALIAEKNNSAGTDTSYQDLLSKYISQCAETKGIQGKIAELSEEQHSLGNDYDELTRKFNTILKEKIALSDTVETVTLNFQRLLEQFKQYSSQLNKQPDDDRIENSDNSCPNCASFTSLLSMHQQSYNSLLEQYDTLLNEYLKTSSQDANTIDSFATKVTDFHNLADVFKLANKREEILVQEYLKLQNDFNALQTDFDAILTSVKENERTISLLSGERDDFKLKFLDLVEVNKQLTNDLQQKDNEYQLIKSENLQNVENAKNQTGNDDVMNEKLLNMNIALDNKDKALDSLRTEFETLQIANDLIRTQNQQYKIDLSQSSSEQQDESIKLRQENDTLTADCQELNTKLIQKDAQCEEMAQTLTLRDNEIDLLRDTLSVLQEQLEKSRELITINEKQCVEAKDQLILQCDLIDVLTNEKTTLVDEKQALQDDLSRKMSENDTTLSKAASTAIQVAQLQQQLSTQNAQNDNELIQSRKEQEELHAQIVDSLYTKIQQLSNDLNENNIEFNQVHQSYVEMTEELEKKINDHEQLFEEQQTLQIVQQQLQKDYQQCESDKKGLEEALSQLQVQYDALIGGNKTTDQALSQLQNANQLLTDKYTALQGEYDALQTTLFQLQAQKADITAQLSELNTTCEKTNSEVADQNAQILQLEAQLIENDAKVAQNALSSNEINELVDKLRQDIKEQQSQLDQRQNDVKNKDQLLDQLQNDMKNKDDEISILNDATTGHQIAIDALNNDIQDKISHIEQLRNDHADNQAQIQQLRQDQDDKNTQIQQLTQDLENKQADIEQLTEDVDNKQTKIDLLTQEKEALIAARDGDVSNNNELITSLQNQITQQDDEIVQFTKQHDEHAASLIQAQDDLQKQQNALNKAQAEVEEQQATSSQLQNDLQEQKNLLAKTAAEFEDQKTALIEAEKAKADIAEQLSAKDDEINTITQHLDEKSTTLSTLRDQLEQSNSGDDAQKSLLLSKDAQLDEQRLQLSEKDGSIAKLQATITLNDVKFVELVGEIAEKDAQLAQNNEQLTQKVQDVSDKNQEIAQLQNDNSTLQLDKKTLEETTKQLEDEKSTLEDEKLKLIEEKSQLEEEKEKLHVELQTAQNIVSIANDKASAFENEKSTLQAQVDALNNDVSKLKSQIDKLKKSCSIYKQASFKYTTTIQDLQEELSSTQDIFADCEAKVMLLDEMVLSNLTLQDEVQFYKDEITTIGHKMKQSNELVLQLSLQANISADEIQELIHKLE